MGEKLTPQQQMAVSNRGGNLLVSAAAGSGKTKVLVDRLISYLMDPAEPANVDDFLIITYTKAAAAELRGKIAKKLTECIAQQPDNRHLQQQMQRLYLAKISTVHAFCADILRENAYRMDIAPDFRVADENECAQLQMQILEQLLEGAYTRIHEDPDLRALIDSQGLGRDDRQIPQIILKVYHSAKCHLDSEGWLDWCVQQAQAEGLTDAAHTIWGKYLVDDLYSCLDMNLQALQRCADAAEKNDTMQKPAALLKSTIAQLQQLRQSTCWDEIVDNRFIDYGRLTFAKNCTDTMLCEQIKAVRDACKTSLGKKLRCFTDHSQQILLDLTSVAAAARGLVDLVRAFSDAYDSIKKRRRILDFADLEHRTLDLLLGRKRTGVTVAAEELAQRFREIMVDEYQDSNQVQDAIFGALTAKRKNCFMVGDVKQSIYQFRLADPGIFLDKYNRFVPAQRAQAGEGRKVLLSSNFRSAGGVISAVNDVFSQCMSVQVGGLDYGEEEKLREGIPHLPLQEPEVELYGIQVQADTYAEEAAFTAQRIRQLLDGSHMIRQGDILRPIRADDIVILLRSPGSVGGEFRYALQQQGIGCTTGDSADLLQTEEVISLISLLQVISNPLQDIPLIAVLSSRLFGFTADELAQIRAKKRYSSMYSALQADTSEKAKNFLSLLVQLRQEARLYRLSDLLERIVLRTGMYSIYLSLPDGEERCGNLQAFLQAASDFANGGQRELDQFLEHLQSMEDRGLLISSDAAQADAVTIMSIHKSKGLEFPVVFLCGLSRSFNQESARAQVLCDKELGLGLSYADGKQRVRYPTIAKRAISAKILAEGISEEMRVLYVAMTRARDRLIMTYARKNLESDLQDIAMRITMSPRQLLTGQADCPGDWILQTAMCRVEAGEFFALGGNPGCAGSKEPLWRIAVVQAEEATGTAEAEGMRQLTLSKEAAEQLKRTLSFRYAHSRATMIPSKQTATQLKGRQKDQEAAENTAERQTPYHQFRKPTFAQQEKSGREYGNAVHKFLQYVRFEKCSSLQAIQSEAQRLVREELLTSDQAALIDYSQIECFLSTELGKQLMTAKNVLREFKFSLLVDAKNYYPDVADEKILMQGVVDCALIEQDGIIVIDFKTDHVTEETLPIAAQRYQQQVSAYSQALERIYGLPVKKTMLYFFSMGRFVEM